MTKRTTKSKPVAKSPVAKSRVIGSKAFAAITAVEGLRLSGASKKRLNGLKSGGLSRAEQRAEVRRAYMGSKGRK